MQRMPKAICKKEKQISLHSEVKDRVGTDACRRKNELSSHKQENQRALQPKNK